MNAAGKASGVTLRQVCGGRPAPWRTCSPVKTVPSEQVSSRSRAGEASVRRCCVPRARFFWLRRLRLASRRIGRFRDFASTCTTSCPCRPIRTPTKLPTRPRTAPRRLDARVTDRKMASIVWLSIPVFPPDPPATTPVTRVAYRHAEVPGEHLLPARPGRAPEAGWLTRDRAGRVRRCCEHGRCGGWTPE